MASDGRAPHAPWELTGEWAVGFARPSAACARLLPEELSAVPGPVIVAGARYDDSPVGPFVELAVAVAARLGLRPGYAVVAAAVSIPPARLGYRVNWGLPAELGTLVWEVDGDGRRVVWQERDLVLSVTARGRSFPAYAPVRAVQRRADGAVVIPRRVRARVRLADAFVETRDGDDLADLVGPHRGALLSAARFVVRPARRPAGILSSLRAPLAGPEPATVSTLPR